MNAPWNSLTAEIEVIRIMGWPESMVFADRVNRGNARGLGNRAKRRAAQIVARMVRDMKFGPQFDRVNRFSC